MNKTYTLARLSSLLRKLNSIDLIQDMRGSLAISVYNQPTPIEIFAYSDETIQNGIEKLKIQDEKIIEKVKNVEKVYSLIHKFRSAIAKANAETEINYLLTEMASVDALIALNKNLVKFKNKERSSYEEIQTEAQGLKDNPQEKINKSIKVNLGIHPYFDHEVKQKLVDLKTKKNEISDKIAFINSSHQVTIDIDDFEAEILTQI